MFKKKECPSSLMAPNSRPIIRILSCYTSLHFGGLATTFVSVNNHLSKLGYKVSLALQDPFGEKLPSVSPQIEIYGLGYSGRNSYAVMFYNMIRLVRKVQPDVIISHAWNTNVLALASSYFCRPRPRMIFWEHTSPSVYGLGVGWRSLLKIETIGPIYRRADLLLAVSEGVKLEMQEKYRLSGKQILVIPSGVNLTDVVSKSAESVEHAWFREKIPIIISCAPLTPPKDLSTLLKAFACIAGEGKYRLMIIGDGGERPRLEKLADDLGISRDFCILGYQSNPYKFVARSQVFVLSSVFEGFGQVLVEAMALGIPVVSTDCQGPIDILGNGRFGILVPRKDHQALARAISFLLENEHVRKALSSRGPARARSFSDEISNEKAARIVDDVISATL
jgi:glycosyltransferase involved in cell wall biosynthesis